MSGTTRTLADLKDLAAAAPNLAPSAPAWPDSPPPVTVQVTSNWL